MSKPIAALVAAIAFLSNPAFAQTSRDDWRAVEALSAMWRPMQQQPTAAAISDACRGAVEEMVAVEAALPPVITPESLSTVKALRGFLIIPAGDEGPAAVFLFPSPDLGWISSGLAAVAALSEEEGLVGVRDAEGHNLSFQLGRAGDVPMLRARTPDGHMAAFVGCAPSASR
ncbi:MAG: hypothetical protein JNM59_14235 [Hyphomonadaceae bacterium]|nr:hypothetical protein [Hyphomonadaceae bacterium]